MKFKFNLWENGTQVTKLCHKKTGNCEVKIKTLLHRKMYT